MPIVLPPAPKLDPGFIEKHLLTIASSTATGPPGMLLRNTPDSLSYTEPHRYYTIALDAIAGGRLLAAAAPGNWRYLIVSQDAGVGELEVSSTANVDGEIVVDRFVALHHSDAAQSTLDELHRAESSTALANEDFELRFLRVVSLYFDAVWLHSKKRDLIIPTTNAIKPLRRGQVYSEGDVIGVLQPMALEAQSFDAQVRSRGTGFK